MDIQPTEQKVQALSDDQELAKVLAGVNDDGANDEAEATPAVPTPPPPPPADEPAVADATAPDAVVDTATPDVAPADDSAAPVSEPEVEMPPLPEIPGAPAPSSDLEAIKQEALGELRPLVDKLDVSPEEKFDTYLLLLRSTDDRDLIAPAHEAAKNIVDEARKAQALLDIIKEIDFLSGNNQQPAA